MESHFSDSRTKGPTSHAALDQVVKVQRLQKHTCADNFNENRISIGAEQSIEPKDINFKP
jgi:hypothetical protein